MPGIEVIVRPSVFPDIRPRGRVETGAPADPDAGRTILTGMDGQVIDLNLSLSQSWSKETAREEYRIFDIVRIYKLNDPGAAAPAALRARSRAAPGTRLTPQENPNVDTNTFIDVEVPHKIVLRQYEDGPTIRRSYRKPNPDDYPNGNIEILEEDIERKNTTESMF